MSVFIVPVPYDVSLACVGVYPTMPHHLVGIECIFGNAHGIGHTTATIVLCTAIMGVGVAEDNLHSTAAGPGSGTRTLTPVIVPAPYQFHHEFVLIVVVSLCRFVFVERTVAFLMVWIAVAVPIFAQCLVAAIFHGKHRVFLALVDVEHLAAVFCLVDVQHLTASCCSASVRVVLVAYCFQFEHMFTAYRFVAAFIEDDAWVVAVVDDCIAHHLRALTPAFAFHIFLAVACRHCLHQSHSVA